MDVSDLAQGASVTGIGYGANTCRLSARGGLASDRFLLVHQCDSWQQISEPGFRVSILNERCRIWKRPFVLSEQQLQSDHLSVGHLSGAPTIRPSRRVARRCRQPVSSRFSQAVVIP